MVNRRLQISHRADEGEAAAAAADIVSNFQRGRASGSPGEWYGDTGTADEGTACRGPPGPARGDGRGGGAGQAATRWR